jgi:hypothetical protein
MDVIAGSCGGLNSIIDGKAIYMSLMTFQTYNILISKDERSWRISARSEKATK